jgi:hypothetical protein
MGTHGEGDGLLTIALLFVPLSAFVLSFLSFLFGVQ